MILRLAFMDGSHQCETPDCVAIVPYDDEPYCFEHSPKSGSHFAEYSYLKDTFNTGKF